jgi:hypothetical protein
MAAMSLMDSQGDWPDQDRLEDSAMTSGSADGSMEMAVKLLLMVSGLAARDDHA